MTLAAATRIFRHWTNHPPIHRMVAAYLGVGPAKPEPKPQYMDFDAFADFIKRTGGRIDGVAPG